MALARARRHRLITPSTHLLPRPAKQSCVCLHAVRGSAGVTPILSAATAACKYLSPPPAQLADVHKHTSTRRRRRCRNRSGLEMLNQGTQAGSAPRQNPLARKHIHTHTAGSESPAFADSFVLCFLLLLWLFCCCCFCGCCCCCCPPLCGFDPSAFHSAANPISV